MRWPCGAICSRALLASAAASVALRARRPQVATSTSCSRKLNCFLIRHLLLLVDGSVDVILRLCRIRRGLRCSLCSHAFFRNKGFWCHTARSCGFEVFSKKVTTASSIQNRASAPHTWQVHLAWMHAAPRGSSPRPRLWSGANDAAEVSDCSSTFVSSTMRW